MSNHALLAEFFRILEEELLTAVFQPIYNLKSGRLLGYETLVRGPQDSPLHSPLRLFGLAREADRSMELETLCRRISCTQFQSLQLDGTLFINVSPAVLFSGSYRSKFTRHLTDTLSMDPAQVVIEVSEQYPLEDYEQVRAAMRHYRDAGFGIAIDDLGAGYAGLRSWAEIRPDYVKIDRHFIAGIDGDAVKQEFVRSIYDIGLALGCSVIAEGLEEPAELDTVRKIGISIGQGYLLGRPQPEGVSEPPAALCTTHQPSWVEWRSHHTANVGLLLNRVPPLEPEERVEAVAERFRANGNLSSLPVVAGGKPLGLVTRRRINDLFAGRYFRELHGRRPISQFMERDTVIVDRHSTLEQVSWEVTSVSHDDFHQDFVIVDNGDYAGVGNVRSLLKRITEQEIRAARYSNPLTLLPGSVPVAEGVTALLREQAEFRFAYFDLNNFKPFNDVYGYSRGDQVIIAVGQLLQQHLNRELDFVGHIGGDDFVAILQSADWEERCSRILADFAERALAFYDEPERTDGGLWTEDRSGERRFFDIQSLAVGVVHPDPRRCRSFNEVASLAAEAKAEAKRGGGNRLFICRRRAASSGATTQAEAG